MDKKNKILRICVVIFGGIIILMIIFNIIIKANYVRVSEIKKIVNNNIGDVKYKSIRLKRSNNCYMVKVNYQGHDYFYSVDAFRGKVIATDYLLNLDSSYLSLESVKDIISKNLAFDKNLLVFDKVILYNDDKTFYEVLFKYNDNTYLCRIDAFSGELLKFLKK